MAKAQYKKRIRSARQLAATTPLAPGTAMAAASAGAADQPADLGSTSSKRPKKKSKAQSSQLPKQREATIAILEKISSPIHADRLWSLAAVSNLLLSSASTRRLLLSKNLVSLLIDRLKLDGSNHDILIETTSALRNLAIEVGPEVCGEMVNKGILKPLEQIMATLLQSFSMTPPPNTFQGPQSASLNSQLLILVENLLTITCETSHKVLISISQLQELVPLLLTILNLFTRPHPNSDPSTSSMLNIPPSLALVSAQCLYTLTEDDRKLVKDLLTANKLEPLIILFERLPTPPSSSSIEECEELELLRVVSAGVLRNVIALSHKPARLKFKASYDSLMPELLAKHLETDLELLASEAAQAHAAIPPVPLSDLNMAKASVKVPSVAELTLESIERRLATIQLSLEILGEWCATADGFIDEHEGEKDQDEMEEARQLPPTKDSDGDEEMLAAEEQKENGEVVLADRMLDRFAALLDRFLALWKPIKELSRLDGATATMIPTGATDSVHSSLPVLISELLKGIQKRALESTNNLAITLSRIGDPSTFPGSRYVAFRLAWQTALEILVREHTVGKSGLALPAVSVLWTMARIGVGEDSDGEVIRCLLEVVGQDGAEADVRARAVGALGCLAARPTVSVEENEMIGNALMNIIMKATQAGSVQPKLLLIHTLDAVFDIYADETREYDDPVFRSGHFLELLNNALPTITSLVKSIDKRKEPGLRSLAEEVLTNLVGFVDYRRRLKF